MATLPKHENVMSLPLLMQLYDQCNLGIMLLGFDRKFQIWNKWLEDASGLSRADVLGNTLNEVFQNIDNPRLTAAIDDTYEYELSAILSPRLHANTFPFAAPASGTDKSKQMGQMISISPLTLEPGRSSCLIQVTDVTLALQREDQLREKAQNLSSIIEERVRELRESEERFRDLYDNAPNAYCSVSIDDGSIIRFNKKMTLLFGYTPEELNQIKVFDLYTDMDDGRARSREIYESLKNGVSIPNAEFRLKCKDGKEIWTSVSIQPGFNEDGIVVESQSAIIDITEAHEARTNLIQVSKMASLGELATGMAHELNQPLNIIRMSSDTVIEMLQEGQVEHDFLKTRLERISTQTVRAATIIDHMRMFGRISSEEAFPFSPKDAVIAAKSLVDAEIKLREITFEFDLPETFRLVSGHNIQFEQVILNLLTNAMYAIEHNNGKDKEKLIKVSIVDYPNNGHLAISIQDSGGGIPPENLQRIFDPFFTSKEIGEGTGLGLSISYGIITEMGGSIEATNVDGGAKFVITLPVADKASRYTDL